MRQGNEVVVARVGGSCRGRLARVLSNSSGTRKPLDNATGLFSLYPLAQLWVRESTLELCQKRARHHQLELTLLPGLQQPGRGTSRREQSRDDDVGVENGAQLTAAPAPGRVLGLDGELAGFFFGKLVSLPKLLQQVEPQIPAQSLLDYRTVALARPGGSNLHGAEDLFLDRKCCPDLGHMRIIASRCIGTGVAGSFCLS